MSRSSRALAAAALSLSLAACYHSAPSAEDAATPPDAGPADAPALDAGIDAPTATTCAPGAECELLTGTGCAGSERCELLGDWDEDSRAGCVAGLPGDGPEGSACDGLGQCAPGLECNSVDYACHRWCCVDDPHGCPTDERCSPLTTTMGLCTADVVCDPIARTGCRPGGACYVVGDMFYCLEPGSVAIGEPCTAVADCVPGALCTPHPGGLVCSMICRPSESDCPDGLECVTLGPSSEYGACTSWGSGAG